MYLSYNLLLIFNAEKATSFSRKYNSFIHSTLADHPINKAKFYTKQKKKSYQRIVGTTKF